MIASAVAQYAQANGIGLSFDGKIDKRDDFTLDSYICTGNPVLLKVGNPHFVVATGQVTVGTNSTYTINDPANYANDSTLEGFGFAYSGLRLFSTNTTIPSALYVVGHSPIELLVTDPQGRRTGIDPVSGAVLSEIPESSYSTEFLADDVDPVSGDTTSDVKEFVLLKPLLGDYTIQVTGNGAGPFSLDFIGYDIAGAQSRVTLTGTTTAGANAMYRAIYSSVAGSQIQAAPLDTTPPAITLAASPNTLWPPNHKMVVVSLSGSVTDNQSGASGVDPSTAAFAVVDEYGQVQPSGSLTLDSAGNYSVAFSLEASRLGDDKDGRQYKVFVSAKDFAGNLGSAFTLVTVPHDQKH